MFIQQIYWVSTICEELDFENIVVNKAGRARADEDCGLLLEDINLITALPCNMNFRSALKCRAQKLTAAGGPASQ